MANPAAPVETAGNDQSQPNSRAAVEALSLSLEMLSQGGGSLALARKMRELGNLTTELARES